MLKMTDVKQALGIEHLVLQIHNASFPSDPDEDLGRGTPYSRGAGRFFTWAAGMGFNCIQFGPRGMTSRGNPSPYDATLFSRNPLDLPLIQFVEQGRLSRGTWDSIRRSMPPFQNGVAPYTRVFDATQQALREVVASASAADRSAASEFQAQNAGWLIPDAMYRVLSREHGSDSWYEWGHTPQGAFDQRLFDPLPECERAAADRLEALQEHSVEEIQNYALIQWLLDLEHRTLRRNLAELGLAVFDDLQVGMAHQDNWAWQRLFLKGYRMGAPPSRTNPTGQPWGYAVLDPLQFGNPQEPGPALAFVRARIARVLAECDGVRIDHPHGWVDPWVYSTDVADPFHAVQSGARLFSSPDNPLHPQLGPFAIARPDQIDHAVPRHADGHVTELDDNQVRRYSLLVDEIVSNRASQGRIPRAVACEVLSTLPYPVARVLERHALGRFRVVQKANLDDASDVYRIENASSQDWIMLGTHDTPSIWQLAEGWCRGPQGERWASYLATRLVASSQRDHFCSEIAGNAGKLVNACFAAILSSQSKNVVAFFPDIFGMTTRYNEPGVISDANWSLRVPADFEQFYADQLSRGTALDLEMCFQMAMTSRKRTS